MLGSGFPGIAAVSPWAKPQPGSAPGTDTSKLEELARLPGISPQLAALLQNKERIQDILAKDPAARSALARAARATNPEDRPLKELRGVLERYIGERKDAAGSIADKLRARQNEIADLRLEWTEIKGKLMGDMHGTPPLANPYWEVYRQESYLWGAAGSWGDPYFMRGNLKFGLEDRKSKFYSLLNSFGVLDESKFPDNGKLYWELFGKAFEERVEKGDIEGFSDSVMHKYRDDTRYYMVTEQAVQALGARILAACDKAQLEVDKLNQEFKNEMTLVNSARGELHDLSKDIVSMSKGF